MGGASEPSGLIFNIQKFCLHDGPGLRTTVFFKGCPLKCKWCSNPESQLDARQLLFSAKSCVGCFLCAAACPNGGIRRDADSGLPVIDRDRCVLCGNCARACASSGGALKLEGRRVSAQEVAAECLKDRVFYDSSGGGVTFSGGEVLSQVEFAKAVAALLHAQGVRVACETAGYAPRPDFERLLGFCDLLLFDVKHYDPQKHLEGTGVSNEGILENLRLALDRGRPLIARIPVVPGYNDGEADARRFGELLRGLGVREVHLLPFHQYGAAKYAQLSRAYELAEAPNLAPADIAPLKEILDGYLPNVQIGG